MRFILVCLLGGILLVASSVQAQTVTNIAAGVIQSYFLKSDGSLWAMGNDQYGQLGDGNIAVAPPYGTNEPEEVVTNGVSDISAGPDGAFIKSDGSLWGMGPNTFGELGNGTHYPSNRPTLIVSNNVITVSVGSDGHILFLKSDGSLWGTGNNQQGQLGIGTYNTNRPYGIDLPVEIETNGIAAIAAGTEQSLFIKSDGSLWAMGNNQYGQLGDGTFNSTNLPEEIVTNGVTAVASGEQFSLFLKNDGSLWAMGNNQYGQLGDGTDNSTNLPEEIVTNGVSAISAGLDFCLFLKSDGSLWGMGDNTYGQLGDGTFISTNRPQLIVSNNVVTLSAGGYHSLFLKIDSSLWSMGYDYYGQLGDGDFATNAPYGTNQPEQIVAGVPPPGFGQITIQLLATGDVQLSFVGNTGVNYALDRTFSLSPADWTAQETNPPALDGTVTFTNTPDPTTNNFWRIRSVP